MGEEARTKEERELDRMLLAWKEQESIAMHFNDLIARFRVQALGGTATIGAVGAFVTSKTEANPWTFVALLTFLFIAWSALWFLDYGYYQKLLGGSVKTLMVLEEGLPPWARLSSHVENSFHWAHHGHFFFYVFIQTALGGLLSAALYDATETRDAVFWLFLVVWLSWTAVAMYFAGPSEEAIQKSKHRRAERKQRRANMKTGAVKEPGPAVPPA